MILFFVPPDDGGPPGGVDVGALFDEHARFLLRVAERLTGQPAFAEDLVQEAFLIAHKKRHQLTPGPELQGWLYRVVSNLVHHHRRTLARQHRLKSAVAAEPAERLAEGPDGDHDRREMAQAVRAAVTTLPHKQREVFVLYELEGLEGAQIAALLDIPVNTVWTRLHHARDRFKKHWQSGADSSAQEAA